jgi:hypothetical protein
MGASAREAKQMVREMRRLALDLPFEEVGEIVELRSLECDAEARRAELAIPKRRAGAMQAA